MDVLAFNSLFGIQAEMMDRLKRDPRLSTPFSGFYIEEVEARMTGAWLSTPFSGFVGIINEDQLRDYLLSTPFSGFIIKNGTGVGAHYTFQLPFRDSTTYYISPILYRYTFNSLFGIQDVGGDIGTG